MVAIHRLIVYTTTENKHICRVRCLGRSKGLKAKSVPFCVPGSRRQGRFSLPRTVEIFRTLGGRRFRGRGRVETVVCGHRGRTKLRIPFGFGLFIRDVVLGPLTATRRDGTVRRLTSGCSISGVIGDRSSL